MSGLGHPEDLKYLGEGQLLCSRQLQKFAVPGLGLVGVEDGVALLDLGDPGHLGDLGVALPADLPASQRDDLSMFLLRCFMQ